jgi:hypothetical protein
MGCCLYLPQHLVCLSHGKTRWTMSVDNVGLKIWLWGPRNPWSLWHFFSLGVRPKWSWDEFNIQSHILQGFGTTSWSTGERALKLEFLGRSLGIIGRDRSVSKSNGLHVDIKLTWGIFSNSSKTKDNFPKVLNFRRLFLKLSRFIL